MKFLSICILTFTCFKINYCNAQKQNLLIGTYTKTCDSKGIYNYEFDSNAVDFQLKSTSENVVNPSFLSISKNKKNIFAVVENGSESFLNAYSYDTISGNLKLLNQQNSNGADPCHLINDDKNVIIANYSGGNIAIYSKNNDGTISQVKHVIQHFGKSINTNRQNSPHVHMVQFSKDNKFVLAADLGNDKIYVYKYNKNAKNKILTFHNSINIKQGSGPRHFVFNQSGSILYLLQELDGTLSTYNFNNGKLTLTDEINIVDKDFKGTFSAAEIVIAPNQQFLYVSNRGEANDISCYEINAKGQLNFKSRTKTLGKGPRSFAIDNSGKFLLVAHQYTNDIFVFSINPATGELTFTGKKLDICSPVCLLFVP